MKHTTRLWSERRSLEQQDVFLAVVAKARPETAESRGKTLQYREKYNTTKVVAAPKDKGRVPLIAPDTIESRETRHQILQAEGKGVPSACC